MRVQRDTIFLGTILWSCVRGFSLLRNGESITPSASFQVNDLVIAVSLNGHKVPVHGQSPGQATNKEDSVEAVWDQPLHPNALY